MQAGFMDYTVISVSFLFGLFILTLAYVQKRKKAGSLTLRAKLRRQDFTPPVSAKRMPPADLAAILTGRPTSSFALPAGGPAVKGGSSSSGAVK